MGNVRKRDIGGFRNGDGAQSLANCTDIRLRTRQIKSYKFIGIGANLILPTSTSAIYFAFAVAENLRSAFRQQMPNRDT